MRWLWICLGLCVFLGCEEGPPPVTVDHPDAAIPTIEEAPVGPRIGPAPLPSNVRARVQQHPSRAEEACRRVCANANGEIYKVGPADTPHGWECLCSWEK